MKITGTHTHKTLGLFTYEAEYTTSRPGSTWIVEWSGIATGANRVLELSNGNIELMVGSAGAAPLVVEKQIRQEIDALT